jgi:hypothetical protein
MAYCWSKTTSATDLTAEFARYTATECHVNIVISIKSDGSMNEKWQFDDT